MATKHELLKGKGNVFTSSEISGSIVAKIFYIKNSTLKPMP